MSDLPMAMSSLMGDIELWRFLFVAAMLGLPVGIIAYGLMRQWIEEEKDDPA